MEQLTGKVAAILDRSTVVINRGLVHGINQGDSFYLYSETDPIPDPDTGEELGPIQRIWGRLKVISVQSRFCLAQTEIEGGINFTAALLSPYVGGQRKKLPVSDGEITPFAEKVKIGSTVVLAERAVKPQPQLTNEQDDSEDDDSEDIVEET